MDREPGLPVAGAAAGRRVALGVLAVLTVVFGFTVSNDAARASVTIESLDMSVSRTQAGTHPDLSLSFSLDSSGEAETAQTATLSAPVGYFLESDAIPTCAAADFASFECPNVAQVGLATLYADYEGEPSTLLGTVPVYLLERAGEELGRLGLVVPFVNDPVEIPVTMRSNLDYGLDLSLQHLPQAAPLTSIELTLWGVPAAEPHDTERFESGSEGVPPSCLGTPDECESLPRPPGIHMVPLLQSPTRCGVPLSVSLAVTTYEHPEIFVASTTSAPVITDCNTLPFGPRLLVNLTSREADASTGLSLDMQQPASEGVDIREPAEVRTLESELPPELIVNLEAAEEQPTCTYAQFGFGIGEPDECPAGSAVGTFSVALGDFETTLAGTAYLGTTEPPETYRLLLSISGPLGTIKLVARLEQDLEEEQVTARFYDLPQIPLRELDLELDADAELLLTPTVCDKYSAVHTVTPWSGGVPFVALDTLTIDEACSKDEPPPLEAGSSATQTTQLHDQTTTDRAPKPRRPKVRFAKRPSRRTHDRTPTFRFKSSVPGSSFRCKIDRHPFHRCASPTTLHRLAYGSHKLRVRAIGPDGKTSAPATWRFRVRRR